MNSLAPLGYIIARYSDGNVQGVYVPAVEITSTDTSKNAWIHWVFTLPTPKQDAAFIFRVSVIFTGWEKLTRLLGSNYMNLENLHFFASSYGANTPSLEAAATMGAKGTKNRIYYSYNSPFKGYITVNFSADKEQATAEIYDTKGHYVQGPAVLHQFDSNDMYELVTFFPRGCRAITQKALHWGNPKNPYIIYPLRSVSYQADGKQAAWSTYNNELYTT